MRASAILALASLMSNMTEAVKVTAAGSGIGPAKLYATPDCSGDFEEKKRGPFCTAGRPWCKQADSVEIPVGKTLVVKYEDDSGELRTSPIVGDGTCVNVEQYILDNGGFDSVNDFNIYGGNVKYND